MKSKNKILFLTGMLALIVGVTACNNTRPVPPSTSSETPSSSETTSTSTPSTSTTSTSTSSDPSTSSSVIVKHYTINYDYSGGSATEIPIDKAQVGEAFRVMTPVKGGYSFAGWKVSTGKGFFGSSPDACTTQISSTETPCYVDGQYIYFKDLCTDDGASVTLTAAWNVGSYTIVWKNYDDSILETSTVEYGVLPVYPGAENPTRPTDAQYTYAFSGWNPDVVPAVANAAYVAKFNATLRQYTITWMNGSTKLSDVSVNYGEVPSYSGTPTKPDDETYKYTFDGWSIEDGGELITVPAVSGDATYYAHYSQAYVEYTISYDWGDGQPARTYKAHYGEVLNPTTPSKPHEKRNFVNEFTGWNPALATVTENATYTATYQEKYDISSYYGTSSQKANETFENLTENASATQIFNSTGFFFNDGNATIKTVDGSKKLVFSPHRTDVGGYYNDGNKPSGFTAGKRYRLEFDVSLNFAAANGNLQVDYMTPNVWTGINLAKDGTFTTHGYQNTFNASFVNNRVKFEFDATPAGTNVNYFMIYANNFTINDTITIDNWVVTEVGNLAIDSNISSYAVDATSINFFYGPQWASGAVKVVNDKKVFSIYNTTEGDNWPKTYINNLPLHVGGTFTFVIDYESHNFSECYISSPYESKDTWPQLKYNSTSYVGLNNPTVTNDRFTNMYFDGTHLEFDLTVHEVDQGFPQVEIIYWCAGPASINIEAFRVFYRG